MLCCLEEAIGGPQIHCRAGERPQVDVGKTLTSYIAGGCRLVSAARQKNRPPPRCTSLRVSFGLW